MMGTSGRRNRKATACLSLACAAVLPAVCMAAPANQPAPDPAERLPYAASRTLTLTRWLVVGLFPRAAEAGTRADDGAEIPAALQTDCLPGGEAAAKPREGDGVRLPDGTNATWMAQ